MAEGDDGQALLKCQAGCETSAVLAAIGRRIADLFPGRPTRRQDFQRVHTYTDEIGKTLYRICKLRPRGWVALRPDPTSENGWSPGVDGVRRVPYSLKELVQRIDDDPVWCCEGERDADTAADLGMVATAAAFNDWDGADLSSLSGRRCVVVCDQDLAGYRLGRARAAALRDAGALVDDEDIVWPRSANDLTDLVGIVGPDLYDVLEELRPIPETAPRKAARSIEERASLYAVIPAELLTVSVIAQAAYLTLDLLAGASGIAKLTVTAFAEHAKIGRNGAAAAFHELEEADWIRELKRGTWQVNNRRRSFPSRSREL